MLEELTSRAAAWWKNFAPRKRGLGLTAVAVSTALVAQGSVVTDASWNDTEWTYGTIGTLNCANPEGQLASRAEGRVLSGSLLGIDLDNIAEAKGVVTTNNGERSIPDPETAPEVGEDAYANPLNIETLNALDINLTGFLELPLETPTAVVGQYAQAKKDSQAVGAAGTVANDGGISLDQYAGDVPDLATLKLSTLLNSNELGLGYLLEDVVDLELKIGAVAGRAWLDGCKDAWHMTDSVTRDYLTSHINLDFSSPTVGALGTTIATTLDTVETTANGLLEQENLLDGVLNLTVDLVAGVLSVAGLLLPIRPVEGEAHAEATINLNLDSIRSIIEQPIVDEAGILSVNLTQGTVQIDTVALVGAAYSQQPGAYTNGLNGLGPNTEPLKDPRVLTELTDRLGALLEDLIDDIDKELASLLEVATVTVGITIPTEQCRGLGVLGGCIGGWDDTVGSVTVKVDGTVGDILSGSNGALTVDTTGALGRLLGSVVNSLVEVLGGSLLPTVGNLLRGALGGLTEVARLPADIIDSAVNPVVGLVSNLYERLFLDGVVSLTVNAQNDPATGGPVPDDWQTMIDGRYDVSALRIGVVDVLGESRVGLYLGRGSVGPVCSPADHVDICSGY